MVWLLANQQKNSNGKKNQRNTTWNLHHVNLFVREESFFLLSLCFFQYIFGALHHLPKYFFTRCSTFERLGEFHFWAQLNFQILEITAYCMWNNKVSFEREAGSFSLSLTLLNMLMEKNMEGQRDEEERTNDVFSKKRVIALVEYKILHHITSIRLDISLWCTCKNKDI